jgi:hypothetical protein
VLFPQFQDALAEIQVAAQGHAAEEVAVALVIGGLDGVGHPALQGKAPGVCFIVAPGQLAGTVSRKAAGVLLGLHDTAPFEKSKSSIERLFAIVKRHKEILKFVK